VDNARAVNGSVPDSKVVWSPVSTWLAKPRGPNAEMQVPCSFLKEPGMTVTVALSAHSALMVTIGLGDGPQ
jgi:hypothetical protein